MIINIEDILIMSLDIVDDTKLSVDVTKTSIDFIRFLKKKRPTFYEEDFNKYYIYSETSVQVSGRKLFLSSEHRQKGHYSYDYFDENVAKERFVGFVRAIYKNIEEFKNGKRE